MPTARVADSYGDNPSEHKPSQDPFDPETADDKQKLTGGVACPGDSTSQPSTSSESSSGRNLTGVDGPARTTESRTRSDQTVSSTARSTGTGRRK